MTIRILFGFLVSAAAVIGAIFTSGGTLDPWSAVQVLALAILVPLGVLIAGPGLGAIRGLFKAANGDPAERSAAPATLRLIDKALGAAALGGFLIHFLCMMKNLSDRAAIWTNLAYALAPAISSLLVWVGIRLPLGRLAELGDAATSSHASAMPTWSLARHMAGILVMIAGFAAYSFGSLSLFTLLDLASAILVVFVSVGAFIAITGRHSWRDAVSAIRSEHAGKAALDSASRTFRYLTTVIRSAGLIGFSTGFVFMIKDWLDRMRAGPTLALALISSLMAIVAYILVALPLQATAERKSLLAAGGRNGAAAG